MLSDTETRLRGRPDPRIDSMLAGGIMPRDMRPVFQPGSAGGAAAFRPGAGAGEWNSASPNIV
jgi:hypothetical protein